MTNEELIAKLHIAAGNLSYYNAAEGSCYSQEREARGVAQAEFAKARQAAVEAGIDVASVLRGYLV